MSGSRRPLLTARRCRAQLSWRLPPRSRRWRSRRPEETGIGGDPGRSGELGVGGEPVRAGDLPDELGGGQRPAADLGDQLRRLGRDQRGELRSSWRIRRVRSRIERISSRAIRTLAPCSARVSLRAIRSSQTVRSSAPAGMLDLVIEVVQVPAQPPLLIACAARRGRRGGRAAAGSPARGPSRCAAGSRSTPSRSAARATASASIGSDLPRVRADRRPRPSASAATRTTRSPRANSQRSNRPDTCRQSSIAHTRSPSPTRAPTAARSSLPAAEDGTVSQPSCSPVAASTATSVCVLLCGSAPITII